MVMRVGYVPEHFLSPVLQFAEVEEGKTFTLVKCPSGTGQLIKALNEDVIDIAIALTDPLIAGIAKGETSYKLVGSYVTTPLNWAVITGKDSKYQKIEELRGTTIGISRLGSGSQTMAQVMALQQGWVDASGKVEKMDFRVNDTFEGLRKSVNDGTTSAFMWEWFTTKPYSDSGEVRFIGSVPTPWPSWLIAAHTSPERAPPTDVRRWLANLSEYVRAFNSPEKRQKEDVEYIMKSHGYEEKDVRAWLETVGYPDDCGVIPGEVIAKTAAVLEQAGFIDRPASGFEVEDFINQEVVRLV